MIMGEAKRKSEYETKLITVEGEKIPDGICLIPTLFIGWDSNDARVTFLFILLKWCAQVNLFQRVKKQK